MKKMPDIKRTRYFQRYLLSDLRCFMDGKGRKDEGMRVWGLIEWMIQIQNVGFLLEWKGSTVIFAPERWQSGRMRRSWKPLRWKPPGVRIPLSPPSVAEATFGGRSPQKLRKRLSPADAQRVQAGVHYQIILSRPGWFQRTTFGLYFSMIKKCIYWH